MFSRPVFAFIFAEWTHDTAQEELESRPIEVIVCANEAHVMIRAWAVKEVDASPDGCDDVFPFEDWCVFLLH